GLAWETVPFSLGVPGETINTIQVLAPGLGLASTTNGLYEYRVGFRRPSSPAMATPVLSVWASSAVHAVAIEDHDGIETYDAGTWSHATTGTNDKLSGVWGSAADNVFVV